MFKVTFIFYNSQEDIENINPKFVLQSMKSDQAQLSLEAHDCVDSIPGLNKMVFAVQELGMIQLQYLISIFLS